MLSLIAIMLAAAAPTPPAKDAEVCPAKPFKMEMPGTPKAEAPKLKQKPRRDAHAHAHAHDGPGHTEDDDCLKERTKKRPS
jgi:hypothetical protein